jgi:hypothetical protein
VSETTQPKKAGRIITWLVAILVALAAFYLMNHVVMGMQGLPLNWNLTPTQ